MRPCQLVSLLSRPAILSQHFLWVQFVRSAPASSSTEQISHAEKQWISCRPVGCLCGSLPPLAASRRASNRLDPSDLPAEPGIAGCWAAGAPDVLQTRPGSTTPGRTVGSVATPAGIGWGAAGLASALFQAGTTEPPCSGLPGATAAPCTLPRAVSEQRIIPAAHESAGKADT